MGDLDELLQSIKEEAKKENSLSLYEGTRQDDLVDKDVDERILRLLGLEEVFDIDYATYLSLLKERMAAARMADSPIPTEETELLTNEFKAVKSKVGRFKIKKKRITADDIRSSAPKIPKALLSPSESGSKEDLTPNKKSAIESDLEPIDDKLDELINVIRKDFAAENKQQKLESRKEQNKSRDEKESKREQKKQSNILGSAAKGAVKPFTGILDRLKKFAMFTFAGFLADKVIKFFTDPANVKKREAVLNFLEDHGPKIFAGALLFLTPLGGLFVGLTTSILKIIGGVGGGLLLKAIGLLATPIGLKALALALAATGIFATVEFVKNYTAGGSGFRAAKEAEQKKIRALNVGENTGQLKDPDNPGYALKAMTVMDGPEGSRFRRIAKPGEEGAMLRAVTVETRTADGQGFVATEEQRSGFKNFKENMARLEAEKNAMYAEIAKAKDDIITEKNIFGFATNQEEIDEFNEEKARIRREYQFKYLTQFGNPAFFENLFGMNQPEKPVGSEEETSENFLERETRRMQDMLNGVLGSSSSDESSAPAVAPVQTPAALREGFVTIEEAMKIKGMSPISAVDPLPIGSVVNHIQLPDKFETVSANQQVKSGTEIPDFNVVNPYPHRSKVTDALGIGYLVG